MKSFLSGPAVSPMFKSLFILSMFLTASVAASSAETGKNIRKITTVRKPVECSVRGGLPNFFRKCRAGKTVSVAYFGGSITQQPGWRVFSFEHFKKMYPKNEFKEINAAIGGTNSTFGVFRMDQDVLAKKPDLVFVEFSVNDAAWDTRSTRLAMEGIVRKIWKYNPSCDICFVYTVTFGDFATLKKGRSKNSVCAMEEIADYYQIPSVDFAPEIYRLASGNKLLMCTKKDGASVVEGKALDGLAGIAVMKDGRIPFSEDGVHPYPDTGHKIYAEILARSLAKMEKTGGSRTRTLKSPLWKGCWEVTKMLEPNDPAVRMTGKISPGQNDSYRLSPGSTLEIKFKGSKLSLFCMIGPGTGSISVEIDDQPEKTVMLFDKWCKWNRRANINIADGLDPRKIHTVKVTVRNAKFDKRSILKTVHQAYYDKNTNLYEHWDLFLRRIFMVGEPVK